MTGSKRLSRLEQNLDLLLEKQNRMQARLKAAKQAIREERNDIVLQNIRRMGFPIEQPVLLIGALLEAKAKLSGPERANCIDHYIELYNDYARDYPNLEACTDATKLSVYDRAIDMEADEEVSHGTGTRAESES